MTQLAIRLLGAPEGAIDGVPLSLSIRKTMGLLAYLACTGIPHTRDALATMFWPESDQAHARGALRVTLAQLKKTLGSSWLFITREQAGLLACSELTVDVAQIEALFAQVQSHAHPAQQACPTCVPLLQQIVALRRGTFLAGFSLPDSSQFEDWQFFETERLERIYTIAFSTLVVYYQAAEQYEVALEHAHRWLALDPLEETVNQFMIQLYLASNQPAAARRHYTAFSALLQDELHTTPQAATTALVEFVDQGKHLALPITSGSRTTHTFPIPTTPLIGRSYDLEMLTAHLADPACQLLTLLGPGGSGKTRLALAIAEKQHNTNARKVVFVPLAGVLKPDAVVATITAAVGCPYHPSGMTQQHLLNFLRTQRMLLILDNIEHLLEDSDETLGVMEQLLDAILHTGSGVQLLVTSRVRLHLYEEQLYLVEGLTCPALITTSAAQTYGAVQLFVQQARRTYPSFELTPANTSTVVQIVQLLSGQPLAIELAAAWCGTLTPQEIISELQQNIDLLSSSARNVPARHRSMRASYQLSWQQLHPVEQVAQQALSVFRGGFTRAAAAEVAHTTPRLLQRMIDYSLVATTRGSAGDIRYELHELLRQFAAEQLAHNHGEEEQLRMRHTTYYLRWVSAHRAALASPQRFAACIAIETELDNIRAAWQWAIDWQRQDLIAESLNNLCVVYQRRGRISEGIAACEQVITALDTLSLEPEQAIVLAQANAWRGVFAIHLLQLPQARTLLERSIALLATSTDQATGAFALAHLGHIAFLEGRHKDARQWLEHSLTMYRVQEDQWGTAATLGMLGRLDWLLGNYTHAQRWYTESLTIYDVLNDIMERIHITSDLAMVTVFCGQKADGAYLFTAADALVHILTEPLEIAQARRYLGSALIHAGEYQAAQGHYEVCIPIAAAYGLHAAHIEDRLLLGYILLMQQCYEDLATLSEETLVLAQKQGMQRNAGFALALLGYADIGCGAPSQALAKLKQCVAIYLHTSTADDQSFALLGLTQAHLMVEEYAQARQVARIALQGAAQSRSIRAARWAMLAWISVLTYMEQLEQAIEFVTLVVDEPTKTSALFYTTLFIAPLVSASATLSPRVVAAAQSRGRARAILATVDELLVEAQV